VLVVPTIRRHCAGIVGQFVLDVMADQGAEFEIVRAGNLGKVVLQMKRFFRDFARAPGAKD